MKFQKEGVSQTLLHALKYQGNIRAGQLAGLWFAQALQENLAEYDALCPVPLHPSKLRKRGYNQSYHICLGMQRASGLPVQSFLKRIRKTETQTKKNKSERFRQMENTFQLSDAASLAGQQILLVDDVLTTGATRLACLKLLDKAGARVGLATLALA
ncbi:MAG: ComF family protein [Cytophagales bacterium]|nr:ComF family protein [Cytophagales bacterium]